MRVAGQIGSHGLKDWWRDELGEAERDLLRASFPPLVIGRSTVRIDEGPSITTGRSKARFLSDLMGWTGTSSVGVVLRRKLRRDIEAFLVEENDWVARHFILGTLIESWYRDRDEVPNALARTIQSCEAQIRIAGQVRPVLLEQLKLPPEFELRHIGYERLAMIREKLGNLEEAIALCQEAKAARWGRDWDKRIARLQKRLERKKK